MNFITEIAYSDDLESKIESIVANSKVTVVRSIPATLDYQEYFKALAAKLGLFIYADEDYRTGKFTPNTWTKVKYIEERSSETYKHSNLSQPMHTDYCYVPMLDIVMLICETQATEGGATTFIDGDEVYRLLSIYDKTLLDKLVSTPVKFGKGSNPIMTSTVKILDKKAQHVEVNWSKFRISDENGAEILEMVKQFEHFVSNYIERSGLTVPVMLHQGEAVFIKDNLVLHGRNSFFGDRCLLKGAIITHDIEAAKKALGSVL